MAAIFQTTFSNAFSWMKMFKFLLRFHCKCSFDNIPSLVQIMAWCRLGDKPLSELMLASLLCIYASLGLSELNRRPSGIWFHLHRLPCIGLKCLPDMSIRAPCRSCLVCDLMSGNEFISNTRGSYLIHISWCGSTPQITVRHLFERLILGSL